MSSSIESFGGVGVGVGVTRNVDLKIQRKCDKNLAGGVNSEDHNYLCGT